MAMEEDLLLDSSTGVAFFLLPIFRSVENSSSSEYSEPFSSLGAGFDFFDDALHFYISNKRDKYSNGNFWY